MDETLEPAFASDAPLRVRTLGAFRVWRDGDEVPASAWGRDKALQLFQLLVTRRRRFLTREQAVDALWPELDAEAGERDFKVALNAIHKALEPDREPRATPRFVLRVGGAYGLAPEELWIDADRLEERVAAGNRALARDREAAVEPYDEVARLYKGDYLPDRRYEDWSSMERERLQILALGAMTTLAELLIDQVPLESLRLTQRVLDDDPVWEEAWRLQMRAHMTRGNRALALRAWEGCRAALRAELGIEPLPETRRLYEAIRADARVPSTTPEEGAG